MTKDILSKFLHERGEPDGDLNWNFLDADENWICTIYSPMSAIVDVLKNEGFDVVYSDFTGIVVIVGSRVKHR